MERTPTQINMWFWSRSDIHSVPKEVKHGSGTVDPRNWGTPYANFVSSDECDFTSHFAGEKIVINLTLCE